MCLVPRKKSKEHGRTDCCMGERETKCQEQGWKEESRGPNLPTAWRHSSLFTENGNLAGDATCCKPLLSKVIRYKNVGVEEAEKEKKVLMVNGVEVGEAGEQDSVQADTLVIYYCLYTDILHLKRKARALSVRAGYLR